jgi:Ca2+-binding EF-hand superfamily protein
MSQNTQANAQTLFRMYRHRASISSPNLGAALAAPPTKKRTSAVRDEVGRLTKADLRRLLHDVDEQLFEFVWGLFDARGQGSVCADDFVAAMALLTSSGASQEQNLEDMIKACFVMFDTRGDGNLTYSEFRSMLEATVTLNLKSMLNTKEGLQRVEAHMQKEFSKENLDFWEAAKAFRNLTEGRLARAEEIVDMWVAPGSEQEVNLPGPVREKAVADFEAAKASKTEPSATIFVASEEEIFKLMERDAYARFKGNPEAVGAVCDDFFKKADMSNDGYVRTSASASPLLPLSPLLYSPGSPLLPLSSLLYSPGSPLLPLSSLLYAPGSPLLPRALTLRRPPLSSPPCSRHQCRRPPPPPPPPPPPRRSLLMSTAPGCSPSRRCSSSSHSSRSARRLYSRQQQRRVWSSMHRKWTSSYPRGGAMPQGSLPPRHHPRRLQRHRRWRRRPPRRRRPCSPPQDPRPLSVALRQHLVLQAAKLPRRCRRGCPPRQRLH